MKILSTLLHGQLGLIMPLVGSLRTVGAPVHVFFRSRRVKSELSRARARFCPHISPLDFLELQYSRIRLELPSRQVLI